MSPSRSQAFPKDQIRCVLVEGVHPAAAALLRDEGFQVETLAKSPPEPELIRLAERAHVLGIRSKTHLGERVLARAPRLLAVGCFCIGTNQVDLARARTQAVPVFNSPFSNTRSVAELTIAEIVALSRRLTDKNAQMHRGEWDKSAKGSHEVRGLTLGIVGYGHIGAQVSVLAEAFGMRVIYHDIQPRLPLGNARSVRTLGELLKEADVVTLHVPETESTRALIGGAQLRKMKKGALLINNARGGVVDVDALAQAIREGALGGAALDVFPDEPAGSDEPFASPLRGLPNVVLTPHVGGSTEEAQRAIALDVAEKLVKFVNVGSTTGAVNVPQVELPEQASPDGARPGRARSLRILHFHQNVPGVLRTVHSAIADLGANISAEYLRTDQDLGYVVMDIDPTDGQRVVSRLKGLPETLRVRLLW